MSVAKTTLASGAIPSFFRRQLDVEDRIVKLPDAPGCWLWFGGMTSQGYGYTKIARRTVYAHRLFYERAFGRIPDGLVVCHRCDTPLCVNPSHLFAGTRADNSRDMTSKSRQVRGEQTHGAVLTTDVVRLLRTSELPNKKLAQLLGLKRSTIYAARTGRRWGHVA